MPKNQKALEAIKGQIQGDTLCHMTDAEKKAYNAEYYRNHKNYWQDYYSKGQTVGRSMARQKYVTEGNGQGVKRRGEGLGTGPVGPYGKNGKKETILTETIIPETILTEDIITEQTPEQWSAAHQNLQNGASASDVVKKHAKQLASDIKTGRKAMADAGKQFVKDWISGAKSLFEKKPVVVTNTWSGTAGGQHVSGSNSFVLRGKKKK